jgi:hypothetical protein
LQGKQAEAKEGNAELEALTKEVAAGKEKMAVMTKKIGQLEAKVSTSPQAAASTYQFHAGCLAALGVVQHS